MTGKEIVNLIRKLREKGIDSDEILKIIEYVEVTLVDRIIDVYMDTKEVNIGILENKIIEDNLYEE